MNRRERTSASMHLPRPKSSGSNGEITPSRGWPGMAVEVVKASSRQAREPDPLPR